MGTVASCFPWKMLPCIGKRFYNLLNKSISGLFYVFYVIGEILKG